MSVLVEIECAGARRLQGGASKARDDSRCGEMALQAGSLAGKAGRYFINYGRLGRVHSTRMAARQRLIEAAALIVAEIEAFDRALARQADQ